MKMLNKTLMALAAAGLSAGAAQAALLGEFVDQGGGLFHFVVSSTDEGNYNAFDITLTGDFTNTFGPGGLVFSNTTDGLFFGNPESYFLNTLDGQAALVATSSEVLGSMSAAFAFGGGAGITNGDSGILAAVRTSNPGSLAFSGTASQGSGPVAISEVPEPGSLALLGLGGLLIARRRRA